jgi:uncharacterized membrane protein YoaK (UPF0700 family)
MNKKRNKIINSFAASAIIAIIFVVVATILGELYSPFKNWLKETFYHHWMGKGIITIIAFYLIGFLGYFKSKESENSVAKMLKILFWIAIIGVLAISGFYLYEYIIHA